MPTKRLRLAELQGDWAASEISVSFKSGAKNPTKVITASNRFDDECYIGKDLAEIQLGNDSYFVYKRLTQLLRKYSFSDQDVKRVLQEIETKCFPNQLNFFNDYRITAFALPVYNSFRETNIGNTKDLDSSVVWRAFQSISSCIETYQELRWADIDYGLSDIDFKDP